MFAYKFGIYLFIDLNLFLKIGEIRTMLLSVS